MTIAVNRGGSLSCLHTDHLGSRAKTTNASETEIASRAYYVCGSTRSISGNLQTDRTFTGQKADKNRYFMRLAST